MKSGFRAVIFDMDGVLLDSEQLYKGMFQQLFPELGINLTPQEYNNLIGISATTMWQQLKDQFGLDQTVDELRELERQRKFDVLQEATLIASAGIPELLFHLKERSFHIALASSSLLKNIRLILQKLELAEYFDYAVSGEQVANGKPAPDIFLNVAAHYDLAPSQCVVIEDSRNGVQAAKSAGMWCVGFINPGSGSQDLSGADLRIDRFNSPVLYSLFE